MPRRRRSQTSDGSGALLAGAVLLLVVITVVSAVLNFLASNPWVLVLLLLMGGGLVYWRIQRKRARAQELARQQAAARAFYQQQLQEQAQRAHLKEQQRLRDAQSIGNLLALTPREFELTVGSLLRARGYRDVRHTGGAGDLGADLVARTPQGELVVVQCKRYAPGNNIGSPEIQTFIGMVAVHHRAERGIFVTTSSFTSQALALGKQHEIGMVDGQELASMFQQLQRPA